MKPFRSLISSALAVTIVFAACTSNTSDTSKENNDTTATANTTSTANDDKQKLEDNKKLVTDFYQALYGDKDSTAIDKYVADNIKEHNPALQDGKDWLKNSLRPFLANPHIEKTKMEIKHVLKVTHVIVRPRHYPRRRCYRSRGLQPLEVEWPTTGPRAR